MKIPIPPSELTEKHYSQFIPEPDMPDFMMETFIDGSGELFNPDHAHLLDATFGVLWTNLENITKGRRILATVQEAEPNGRPWSKGLKEVQLQEWFTDIPTFMIIIDGVKWMEFSNLQRCAILEHELYHCAQKKDKYGIPKFHYETGLPLFTTVGHDVEEFIGVVKRYGAHSEGLKQMEKALNSKPELSIDSIEGVCGNCMKKVA